VAGKISWYQQLDFQSLAMEFSGGKLKQKGFFLSVEQRPKKANGYGSCKFVNKPAAL
jgi:hypothetical protein